LTRAFARQPTPALAETSQPRRALHDSSVPILLLSGSAAFQSTEVVNRGSVRQDNHLIWQCRRVLDPPLSLSAV
jgi:hypothetical protein